MITIYSHFTAGDGEHMYDTQDNFETQEAAQVYFDTVVAFAHRFTVLEETPAKIKYQTTTGAVASVQIGR